MKSEQAVLPYPFWRKKKKKKKKKKYSYWVAGSILLAVLAPSGQSGNFWIHPRIWLTAPHENSNTAYCIMNVIKELGFPTR
jgi:hypothetical protein